MATCGAAPLVGSNQEIVESHSSGTTGSNDSNSLRSNQEIVESEVHSAAVAEVVDEEKPRDSRKEIANAAPWRPSKTGEKQSRDSRKL